MIEAKERAFFRRIAPVVTVLLLGGAACGSSDDAQGKCHSFTVYAQNRFPDYGANGRSGLSTDDKIVEKFDGNDKLQATGSFVKGEEPAYPDNPKPIRGLNWLIVETENHGLVYVNDAALRAEPTEHATDPKERKDLGPVVKLDPSCQLPK